MPRKIGVVPLLFAALCMAIARPGLAEDSARSSGSVETSPAYTGATDGGREKYLALPLAPGGGSGKPVTRYGVPFIDRTLPLTQGGSAAVKVGARAERIFLLGMTDATTAADGADDQPYSPGAQSLPGFGWHDPRDLSYLFIVGDELGRIRVDYADGTEQVFPLRLGEGVWWGRAFYDFDQPFPVDAHLRQAFADALRLYPARPLEDGGYVAVIDPKPVAIRSIGIENSPAKKGTLIIKGITLETRAAGALDPGALAGAETLAPGAFPEQFAQFVRTRPLLPAGSDDAAEQQQLTELKEELYSSGNLYRGLHVAASAPAGYTGPEVSFKGSGEGAAYAGILANVFRYNVQDILAKIDDQGMYHTSTRGAISWGGYRGIGTFRYGVGAYYGVSYTRDMGRSMGEVATLGYTKDAERNADYDLKMARRYATDPALRYRGVQLPPHWGMLVNSYRFLPGLENDGQGLTALFLFKLWQQLPDRDAWLRARWPDVKAAGDWVLWQLNHPEISGAKDGVLHTTGESANMDGYSVYPDAACMHALRALAVMADSIGEKAEAAQWREGADRLQAGITSHYIVNDPKYGRIWSLDYSNWTEKSTVLGPLIFQADNEGFAPEDSYPEWRAVNEAAYQRILDTYKPFGFYGQSMGYGQGFVTQSALLLDRMRDATTMLDWAAKEIYDPRFGSRLAQPGMGYIVPEGARIDPAGQYWFHIGDLGNGVQEAEIVKTLRVVMGVDDTHPERLQFFPRMPYDWSEIAVSRYPIVFETSGKLDTADLAYTLKRAGGRMDLRIAADKDLGRVVVRLGPFGRAPQTADVRINGKMPKGARVERSGDSWWVRFAARVGPR
ncbi:MAG TPA: hypothetical protein VKU93_04035 [Terracidiphilus sp.]|nr:hypothetical protein [Terracidiphilus sp.]